MAKLQEQIFVVKISRLLRDTESESDLLTDVDLQSLDEVLQQLAGERSIVEIIKE